MKRKKEILTKKSLEFLEKYLDNPTPSGSEEKGQQIWLDYITQFTDKSFQDEQLNAVAVLNPNKKYRVALEAHADEISWQVSYISDTGFLYVNANGGPDPMVAIGNHVHVLTEDGIIEGVFGWPAVHLREGDTLKADEKHLYVDIGASSKDEVLEMGVNIGDAVVFYNLYRILNKKFIVGRALDNRIGGLIIAEVARLIHEEKIDLPFSVMFVNSVQEEVGLYGAEIIAERLKPDMAIITDVTHDTSTPFIQPEKHGDMKCGKGPVIAIAPAVKNKLLKLMRKSATEADLPFQLAANSKETGTDTEKIAHSDSGVMSVLISPPIRYMHTPVEIVHMDDVENTILIILETLKNISPEVLRKNRTIPFYEEQGDEAESGSESKKMRS